MKYCKLLKLLVQRPIQLDQSLQKPTRFCGRVSNRELRSGFLQVYKSSPFTFGQMEKAVAAVFVKSSLHDSIARRTMYDTLATYSYSGTVVSCPSLAVVFCLT